MKHLSRLLMLAALVIFVSCQNEELAETQTSGAEEVEETLTNDGDFAEGEEAIVEFNDASEKLVVRTKALSLNAKGASANCTPDIESLVASLPETVSLTTTVKPGDESYFLLDIHNTNLSGTDIPAWCVDVDLSLGVEGPIDFDVYSSYGELPEGKFEKPENFDLVNWILNQGYVGTESPNGGSYTFGHVQWAIWELVDDRNCRTCTYLTTPLGDWRTNEEENIRLGQEIVDAALANGEGYTPGCGDLFGIVLVPEGKQSIIITKEVPSEECADCEGKVTELTLKFDHHRSRRVKIYQKKENSCWAIKVFDKVLQPGEEFTINGANQDGTFGRFIYAYVGSNRCYYYTKIKTNCDIKIGPGYEKGVFEVVSGRSSEGGELCEYVKPEYNCWSHRHWSSKYYWKWRYKNHGY